MKNIDYLKGLTIAHRGIYDNIEFPENSFLSCLLAKKEKLPIELDVRYTKDKKLVIFHDNNLYRMTGINKKVNKSTFDEIKNFSLAKTKYKIPLLEDILSLINGNVLLNLEIKEKNTDICLELVKILDNYNGTFIISSFYPNIISWFRKNRPNYIIGLIVGVDFSSRFGIFDYCKADFIAISKKQVKFKKIQKKRNAGTIILTWTIQNKEELLEYSDYSDSFIANIKPNHLFIKH